VIISHFSRFTALVVSVFLSGISLLQAQQHNNLSFFQLLESLPPSAYNRNTVIQATFYDLNAARQGGLVRNNDITPLLERWVSPKYQVLSAFALSQSGPDWKNATGVDVKNLTGFAFYTGKSGSTSTLWKFLSPSHTDGIYMGLLSRGFARVSSDGILSNAEDIQNLLKKKDKGIDMENHPFIGPSMEPVFLNRFQNSLIQSYNIKDLQLELNRHGTYNFVAGNGIIQMLVRGMQGSIRALINNAHIFQGIVFTGNFGRKGGQSSSFVSMGEGNEGYKRQLPRYSIAAAVDYQQPNGTKGVLFTFIYEDCIRAKNAVQAFEQRYKEYPERKSDPLMKKTAMYAGMNEISAGICAVNVVLVRNHHEEDGAGNPLYLFMAFGILKGDLPLITADID